MTAPLTSPIVLAWSAGQGARMMFETDGLDRAKFARIASAPAPRVEYCIYFTPRSGSSWLTDLATRSGHLGAPKECFNPDFMPRMAHALGAADMDEYVHVIRRRFAAKGTFGLEITYYQLLRIFGGSAPFMARFGRALPIWLIREDIVAQAVSLWKMRRTGLGHSVSSTDTARAQAEAALAYDAAGIGHDIDHIRKLEILTERHFSAHALAPLRLSYEAMMHHGPASTRTLLAHVLGLTPEEPTKGDPAHTKIGTAVNDAFAARFRGENARLCADLAASRAPMLDQVVRDWSALPSRVS